MLSPLVGRVVALVLVAHAAARSITFMQPREEGSGSWKIHLDHSSEQHLYKLHRPSILSRVAGTEDVARGSRVAFYDGESRHIRGGDIDVEDISESGSPLPPGADWFKVLE